MSAGWYDHDVDEQPEITFLRRHRLTTGARCFDLGAHQCVVAVALAQIVGPEGQVVAVEANRHNATVGVRNKELNRCDNLQILHAAAADKSGVLVFNTGLNGQVDDGSGAWGRAEVPALTVDELTDRFGPPDLLFIDVEGFECRVLDGAVKTLDRTPDCFVEVHVGVGLEKFGGSVDRVMQYFPRERYSLYMMPLGGEPVPFAEGNPLTTSRFFLFALRRA
jgi:FkbM family methyltransferase